MLRNSRLAIFAFTIFFFLAGALTAYVRCLENAGSLWNQSEIGNAEDDESYSDTEFLHCPDDLKAYANGQLTNLKKQNSKVKQGTNYVAASCSKPAEHAFASGISAGLSPSLFPYRLVSLYQFNVVYRI